jgi:LPXTG-site transpeptidase (sortase) family protein
MYTLPNQPQQHWFKPVSPANRPKKNFFVELVRFLGLFLFFFITLVLIVMGPTYYNQLSYLWEKPTNNYSTKYDLPVSVGTDSQSQGDVNNLFTQRQALFAQDTVIIPKIGVDAPIVYLDTSNNSAILEAIKNGIGHYQGTAMPGQNGNVFLTGHSSYYWWSKGKYNDVFARLHQMQIGDLIYIYYQNQKYIYRVNKSFVVRPEQVDVLNPTTSPTLTIMTCTPVGTNLRRLIVTADLISQPSVKSGDFKGVTNIPKPPTILPLY